MRHLSAYMLLVLGGNASPTADDVKGVLSQVGVEADDAQLEKLMSELEGKDINTLIAEGLGKLSSVPSGGAAVSGGSAATEVKEEEAKVEEEEEESSEAGGMGGLFGDDDDEEDW